MTAKRVITIVVEATSQCSEASLEPHVDSIVESIMLSAINEKYNSWNTTVDVDWEESYSCELSIDATYTRLKS